MEKMKVSEQWWESVTMDERWRERCARTIGWRTKRTLAPCKPNQRETEWTWREDGDKLVGEREDEWENGKMSAMKGQRMGSRKQTHREKWTDRRRSG